MEKLHNIVYETLDTINNFIYIGVHCTDNLDDGYLGTGKRIKYAIKKHGKENFKRTILHDVDNAELAYFIEELLVDEDFLKRDNIYNLRIGGLGGLVGKSPWNKGLKGVQTSNRKGISPSKETRQKMKISKQKLIDQGICNVHSRKKVLCITTGEIFDSIADARKKYTTACKIIGCCRGYRNFAGKLPDGTKLQWKYLQEENK